MTAWALLLSFALFNVIFAADEVTLTSSEKKNLDEVDMSFGEADPVRIMEIKREEADIAAKKKREEPATDKIAVEKKSDEPARAVELLTPGEEAPKREEIKPVPVKKSNEPTADQKKIEKRRQHRAKKPLIGGKVDKDGIEDAA